MCVSTMSTSLSMLFVASRSTSGRACHQRSTWVKQFTAVLYRSSFFSVPENSDQATTEETTTTNSTEYLDNSKTAKTELPIEPKIVRILVIARFRE